MQNNNFFRAASALSIALLSLLCGCESYRPAPVAWEAHSAQWNAPLTEVRKVDPDAAISLALALNPEINLLRLKKLSSQGYAAEAGWWQDPSLGFEALRILDGGENPDIAGLGISFTFPLNGSVKLKKLAAKHFAEADRFVVDAAERDLVMRVVSTWLELAYCEERIAVLQEVLREYNSFLAGVDHLVRAGEIKKSEGDMIQLKYLRYQESLAREQQGLTIQHSELFALLGVHPSANLRMHPVVEDFSQWLLFPQNFNELDFTGHPSVRAQLARLDANEHELHAEIRAQYPVLTIGPRFGNEEGRDRLGLEAGLTLPLWNRNRQGIAEARGSRDRQRQITVMNWRELVKKYHRLLTELRNTREQQELIESGQLPLTQAMTIRQKQLFKKGECPIAQLLQTSSAHCHNKLRLLNEQKQVALKSIELHLLTMFAEDEL